MRIIGCVGLIGSGKDTVIEHISKQYGFEKISVGDLVRNVASKKNIIPTRDNLHKISMEYTEKHGVDYFIRQVVGRIRNENLDRVTINGIRSPADVSILRSQFGENFTLILIKTSDPKRRFERLKKRNELRDPKTWKEFIRQERKEEEIYSLGETCRLADYTIVNDSELSDLIKEIDRILQRILSQNQT